MKSDNAISKTEFKTFKKEVSEAADQMIKGLVDAPKGRKAQKYYNNMAWSSALYLKNAADRADSLHQTNQEVEAAKDEHISTGPLDMVKEAMKGIDMSKASKSVNDFAHDLQGLKDDALKETGALTAQVGDKVAKVSKQVSKDAGKEFGKQRKQVTKAAQKWQKELGNLELPFVPAPKKSTPWLLISLIGVGTLGLAFLGWTLWNKNNQATTAETEIAREYPGNPDLQAEIKNHRETFLGDAQTGGALIDKNSA